MAIAAESPRRSRLRRTRGLLSWLLALGLAAGWALYLRPAGLGGPAGYVIVSGESMEPMMHTGDLAVVRKQPEYKVGDVVAYKIPQDDVGGGQMVIHRVVGGTADEGLVLKGDNRDTEDMWRPRHHDVVGTLLWHIPHAGTALFLLRTPLVLAGVAGFLGFWFVATWSRTTPERDEERGESPAENPVTPTPGTAGLASAVGAPRRGHDPATGTLAAVGVVVISVAAYAWQHRTDRA